jgi:hypothetical protein
MQDADSASAIVLEIQNKLRRIIKTLDSTSSSHQHAVRIINSRIRLLDRLYASLYLDGTAKHLADVELSLDSDNGDLLDFGGRRHTIGLLTCKACATGIASDSPFPKRLIRLCGICHKGACHSTVQVTTKDGKPISSGSTLVPEDTVATVLYQCEKCGNQTTEVVN